MIGFVEMEKGLVTVDSFAAHPCAKEENGTSYSPERTLEN
jgi:hypothetical protein